MGQIFSIILMIVVFCAILSTLIAWPFMLIWNYAVVAALSVANPITFWQAFWLAVFCSAFVAGSNSSSSE